jgi:hypothetical protein
VSFNDYINKKNGNKGKQPSEDDIKSAYQKYSGFSQEELMREMFRTAEESRKKGELSDEMLDGFYNRAQSFMSPEQAERMRELIIELKKQE